ncbi:MAG: Na+/H+ antiporter subunit G [Firmicutes bacterium]|nr:Na+/H+ antiporter subunit G [Bacillota bacterium]
MLILRILIDVLLVGGCFFALAGTLGVLRMPDSFSRMQASTNIPTFGLLGIVLAALLYAIFMEHNAAMAVKVLIIGGFVLLTNPIVGNTLSRAAYKYGIRPKKPMVQDDYGRDEADER